MSKRTKQAPSWTSGYGQKSKNKIVGQIFFPYNSSSLDDNDRRCLEALADFFSSLALRKQVKLQFCGHCDYRGGDEYNRRLARKRAQTVQSFVRSRMLSDRRPRFFTSTSISHGETFAGKNMDYDRRVDIISSFVPKPPPGSKPPVVIEGKPTVKRVRRPVQFLQIDMVPPQGKFHTSVIIEKYAMIPVEHNFPYGLRTIKSWMHMDAPRGMFSFPAIHVYRNEIKWRKKRRSDTAKKVASVFLNYLRAVAGVPGEDFDFSEGIPGLKRAYKSWADYKKRGSKYFREYENM